MHVKQKKVVTAIKRIIGAELVLTAALIPLAHAQTADTTGSASATGATSSSAPGTTSPGVSTLQRVEVTGSLIRTADKTGSSEVQTVTAKQIEQSGYTTVAAFLRGMSANAASSWSESTMNTTAPGGAGIALRGLSEKYTLVLVDGQRVANYALPVNFSDTFFDVNTIPLSMVERIEVVKTGAVSQYGSDAIGGVVNIITKKNFQGLQIDGQLGKAQHPGDGQGNFSVLAGIGNLATDRWNITGSASWYRDAGSTLADRDMTAGQDFRQYPGGTNAPAGPTQQSFWTLPDGSTAPLSPCPPGSDTSRTGGAACSYNSASKFSLVPSTTRLNAKVRGTVQLTDTTQAYADFWLSRDETIQAGGNQALSSQTNVYNPVTGNLAAYDRTVPASNPYNPYGVPTQLNYAFPNATVGNDTVSTFWKISSGLKGTYSLPKAGDWDWAVDAGHSQSTVSSKFYNSLNVAGLQNMIQNGTYNFANPSATPNGLDGVFTNDDQLAITKLETVNATTSTSNLFTLPTGDIGLGFGTEFRHENSLINPRTLSSQGIVAPGQVQSVNGTRNVAAIYYQAQIPLLRNLVFTQAGRYDHYSDFGGAFSPSFALRYQPVQAFTGYASYSRGFRAPTLVENSQAAFISHQNLVDPFHPGGAAKAFTAERNVGNPDLQPEHTKNYNLGFQLSPDSSTDFGAAFYKIHIGGVIGTADPTALLAQNDPSVVVRNPDGTLNYINTAFENLGSLDTDGFDFNFRKSMGSPVGTFTLSGDWTYVWHYKLHGTDGSVQDFAGNNFAYDQPFGATNPRWKGNTDLSWAYRNFTTTLTWQYTGPYTNAVAAQNGDGGSLTGASYSQFNLFTSYRGFKNWTIYAGINNLFDKKPPFDVEWYSGPDLTGYDQSLYTNVGRTFQVGATYRFK